MFPTESIGTYYIPAIRKADSPCKRSVMAKGKLVDKVRNIVHKCEEATPRRKKRSVVSSNDNDANRTHSFTKNDDVLWLEINTEPWDDVIQKWESTYTIRRNDKTETVTDFFEHWPILKKIKNDILVRLYVQI